MHSWRSIGRTLLALLALATGTAAAQSSTLTFVSEPGDWVGQGQSLAFHNLQATASSDNNSIGVSINDSDHWFYLNLAAPQGAALTPGVYEGAVRYPFQDPNQPGLSFYGDGRGCNTLTGRFEVLEAVYGPYGYLQKFHATFEQHCEGGEPALFGEVSIDNPPPPPALSISLQLDDKASVRRSNGQVTVSGTVTCSAATSATINGNLSQRAGRFQLAQGGFYISSGCSPTPTKWTAAFASTTGVPFNQGPAQLDATAEGWDPNYGGQAQASGSVVANLITVKK